MGNQSLAFYFGELIAHIAPVLIVGGISAMISKSGLKNGLLSHSAITSLIFGAIAIFGSLSIADQTSNELELKTPTYFLLVIPILLFSISFLLQNSSWNEKSENNINKIKIVQDFKKLFLGRIGRFELFKYQLASGVVFMLLAMSAFIPSQSFNDLMSVLWMIKTLVLIIIGYLIVIIGSVRRLHDINLTGWYSILTLIPILGFIFSTILLFVPGNKESNKYGEIPK